MKINDIRAILQQNPWFEDLPEHLSAALLERSATMPLKQGEVLMWQKETEVQALYCILRGAIKISSNSMEGKEAVLTYLAPGTWFGEISVFDGLNRTHTAKAHEDSVLLYVSKADVYAIIAEYPDFYPQVIKLLCEKIRTLMIVLEEASLQSLSVRLASRLLMLAESFGMQSELGIEIQLRLPQEELGQMLGISRQSTNKLLKQFEQERLISTTYRHVVLTDLTRLRALIG